MNHAPYCLDFNEKVAKALREFEWKYPNYCRACGGTGEVCEFFDPSPAGVSLSPGSMMECDPCALCIDDGNCPRCSAPAIVDRGPLLHEGCSNCGWQSSVSAPAPPPGECTCYDDEEWHRSFDDYPEF